MDPLSEVLSLLKVTSYNSNVFMASAPWSLRFAPHDGLKFYAALSGRCWLALDGGTAPLELRAGECLLLTRGDGFQVASDLALPSRDVMRELPAICESGVHVYQGGQDFSCLTGYFSLSGVHTRLLLEELPPVVQLREDATQHMLRWTMERMQQELREPRPGGMLMAQQLATMLLIEVLRLHLSQRQPHARGWLSALSDRQMTAAIEAIHEAPEQRWTVQSLAERAGMSRTSFALKFKELTKMTPIDYVRHWRMTLASERLLGSEDSIAHIAASLGYESESAFSTAFKRMMGRSPRRYAAQVQRERSAS